MTSIVQDRQLLIQDGPLLPASQVAFRRIVANPDICGLLRTQRNRERKVALNPGLGPTSPKTGIPRGSILENRFYFRLARSYGLRPVVRGS